MWLIVVLSLQSELRILQPAAALLPERVVSRDWRRQLPIFMNKTTGGADSTRRTAWRTVSRFVLSNQLLLFIVISFVLLLATDLSWRSYVMAWLAVQTVVTAFRYTATKQLALALSSVSFVGLIWLWLQGGEAYSGYSLAIELPALAGVVVAGGAFVAIFGLPAIRQRIDALITQHVSEAEKRVTARCSKQISESQKSAAAYTTKQVDEAERRSAKLVAEAERRAAALTAKQVDEAERRAAALTAEHVAQAKREMNSRCDEGRIASADLLNRFGESIDRRIGQLTENLGNKLHVQSISLNRLTENNDGLRNQVGQQMQGLEALRKAVASSDTSHADEFFSVTQQLLTVERDIELLDGRLAEISRHIRQRLDYELRTAGGDGTTRVLAGAICVNQEAAAEVLSWIYESFLRAISLDVTFREQDERANVWLYALWRSADGLSPDAAFHKLLCACPTASAEPMAGLRELRGLLLALYAAGPGTLQIGPMVVSHAADGMLGAVVRATEHAAGVVADLDITSPQACMQWLSELSEDRLVNLSSWALAAAQA